MSRELTTSRLLLDIRKMYFLEMIPKNGYKTGRFAWYQNNTELGYINYQSSVGRTYAGLQLIYQITYQGGEVKNINQEVLLTGIDCHFGGFRWYFKCPGCNARVAVLYSGQNGFYCRKCNHLAYEGQNDSKLNREGIFRLWSITDKEEKMIARIGRTLYKGKPTRKYKQLLDIQKKNGLIVREEVQKEYNKTNNEKF